jgi:ATP-binding cassette subfamily B (MDR/TAP) protein 1
VGEDYEINKYTNHLQKTLTDSRKYTFFMSVSIGIMIMVFLGCYGLGFWYGKIIILDYGNTVADVISTFFCIIMGGASIGQIAPSLKNIALGKAALAKMFELIDRVPTLVEPENGLKVSHISNISFRKVEFEYPKNPDVKVIKELDIDIQPNKTTAIVGESGSGKSTIVQLVQRFYDPTIGAVLINGTNLKELDLESYHKQIGYVSQEPVMFSMSIRDNLLFAREDAT